MFYLYMYVMSCYVVFSFMLSSRRRHTRCALVTGVQTCALPICFGFEIFVERDLTAFTPDAASLHAAKGCHEAHGAIAVHPYRPRFQPFRHTQRTSDEIGRASCRERVCQYV